MRRILVLIACAFALVACDPDAKDSDFGPKPTPSKTALAVCGPADPQFSHEACWHPKTQKTRLPVEDIACGPLGGMPAEGNSHQVCWYEAPTPLGSMNAEQRRQRAKNDRECVRQSQPDTVCSLDGITRFYKKGSPECDHYGYEGPCTILSVPYKEEN
ncbi:MAG: hypothetical protein ABW022_00215 [Actinoplanes sp.]